MNNPVQPAPETLAKQLALVIDLNVCVGCHACVTSCKEWNTSGAAGPLTAEQFAMDNTAWSVFGTVDFEPADGLVLPSRASALTFHLLDEEAGAFAPVE